MDVGMTLPVMEPDLWERAGTLERWARDIDAGPWSSLCFGERMAFDNPEALTTLGAVAAWTSRVRLVTTVVVPQLHDVARLAKACATADRLCGGRLTVGLGVGGREEDYRSVGADLGTQTMAGLADSAHELRRLWSGEPRSATPGAEVGRIGPPPVQPGGPPLLVGTMGPRTVRSAAAWATGLAGVTMNADVDETARLFQVAREAWARAGRPAPLLTTSFWFALDEGDGSARAQVHRHLRHYMSWLPSDLVDALAVGAGFAGTPVQLRDLLDRFAAIGADEVQLIPTSADVTQLGLLADHV
ncbi:LLM class flavin-dependent oxidoreductase [Nocardioides acrostichi]|uniref:LLM class flavin-dependent oxidoreductase n=1 Tax=Nocardioides acrostichi TaxID=2784339 RepID=A0A930YC47_9ACTN|nr:LLM class flavin-dependent oxidoreductase [Nocardioides acrostichi]MBF4161124.1 LLM class flavin-dependent oxidoreductase [Nocardioides acrostichi]